MSHASQNTLEGSPMLAPSEEPEDMITQKDALSMLEGARNFRDVGGHVTSKGLTVRSRRIFRSNSLARLTDRDVSVLEDFGLVAIFDLRSQAERQAAPTAWTSRDVETHAFRAQHKRRLIDMATDYPPTREGALTLMRDFYREMPSTMGHVFGDILARIGDGAIPCIIHCSAGKDRTGVAIAILLAAFGVPRAAIVEDYARSSMIDGLQDDMAQAVIVNGASQHLMRRYPPEALSALMDAAPDYIGYALDGIDERFGSIEAYLDAHGVASEALDRLRSNCLEGWATCQSGRGDT
jgi:protein-tyrosine phosphatase